MTRSFLSLLQPFIDKFPRIASLYRNVRDQMDSNEDSVLTRWGFKFKGNIAMALGTFEPEETERIRSILHDVDVLVNVGANIGYYCCHALNLGKKVIAFEPIQKNLKYLYLNIRTNGWTDVEIFPLALSNKVDVLEIYGADTGASILKGWAGIPENYKTLVPASTLDNVVGARLNGQKVLVLVDIEGAEKWMLEGASLMLSNDPKPIWLIEIMTSEHQPSGVKINPNFSDTFKLFFNHGYQAFNINNGLHLMSFEDVQMIASGLKKLQTHNFIFCDLKDVDLL